MDRRTATRITARTAVVTGLMAGIGVGLLGAQGALAGPVQLAAPPVVAPPIVEPPVLVLPTRLPPITQPPVYTVPPIKTLTRLPLPPTSTDPSTTTPTTPSSTTTAPPTTTTHQTEEHWTTPKATTPLPTPSGQPRPFPKGAPETGGGDGGSTPALALGALVVGLGGVAGGTILFVRRRAVGGTR